MGIYRGPVVAIEYAELVSISGDAYREIMGKYVIHDHMLGKYVSLFAQRAVHQLSNLDIWFDTQVLDDLAWCAFQEGADFSAGLPLDDSDDADVDNDASRLLVLPPRAKDEAAQEETQKQLS